MSRTDAARYIGISVTKFDEMVFDGRMPKPRRIDARRVWDRFELDAYFSDLASQPRGNQIDAILARGHALPADEEEDWRATV